MKEFIYVCFFCETVLEDFEQTYIEDEEKALIRVCDKCAREKAEGSKRVGG